MGTHGPHFLLHTEYWKEYGMLLTISCGGSWHEQRKADAGLRSDDVCNRCKCKAGTAWHSIWECSANKDIGQETPEETTAAKAIRKTACLERVAKMNNGKDEVFWTRGLIPQSWYEDELGLEEPTLTLKLFRVMKAGSPVQGRLFFTDGSGGRYSQHKSIRRCGWSWIRYGDECNKDEEYTAICGTLPGQKQSPGRAELFAVIMLLSWTPLRLLLTVLMY